MENFILWRDVTQCLLLWLRKGEPINYLPLFSAFHWNTSAYLGSLELASDHGLCGWKEAAHPANVQEPGYWFLFLLHKMSVFMHITTAMNQIELCSYSVQPLVGMFLYLVVGVEFRALHMLSKYTTSTLTITPGFFYFYLFVFYAGFHYVVQIGLNLTVLLSQRLPECCD